MEYFLGAFSKYADFSGRARRKEYWNFVLFYTLIYLALAVVSGVLTYLGMSTIGAIVSGVTALFALVLLVPSISMAARRLHDTGRSGWLQLIAVIPLIGAILLFVWMIKDGEGENQYGQNPKMIEA